MKKFNKICYEWVDDKGSVSPMPEVKPARNAPKRYKHKDGAIYTLKGYVGLPFEGYNYILVAYSPEDKNREHEVYFRTQGHFAESFKEVKEEYEYQWLEKNKATGSFSRSLAFRGEFETEEYALVRFKRDAFEDMIDWREYELIKIEETKRVRNV